MRNKFYIKNLRSISKDGKVSQIEFINGLNIIHGPSNTGKTLIVRCIDYMFGAEKLEGLEDQTYIEMDIMSNEGKLSLKRNIQENKNYIEVVSSVKSINSDRYKIRGNNSISDVWLSLIGVKQKPIKIIKNENYKTQNMTWRTISHMFLLSESEIIREKPSIILPKQNTSNTAFISSLDFLITGVDHSELENLESPENKKIKKEAIKDYINLKIQQLSKHRSKINDDLLSLKRDDVEQKLNDAIKTINYDSDSLKEYTENNKKLIRYNHKLYQEMEENSVSIVNFNNLLNQYEVDIERLALIVEGNISIHEHKENIPCPFCNSEIKSDSSLDYISDSLQEIEIIRNKYNDLKTTIQNLEKYNQNLEIEYNQNAELIKTNTEEIENILKPRINKLKQLISEYNNYFNYLKELELIDSISKEWNTDLTELDEESAENNKYKPKEKLPSDFYIGLNKIIESSLRECSYPDLVSGRLDKSTFDIVVNGKSKASQGKGYRAYLNTILALSLREYLHNNAKYYNPIFVSDTPLLGLDEKIEPGITSMRIALHQYLKKASAFGQIIIADNNKDLPEINFDKENINSIEFTKSKDNGRYGFLNGLTD